MVGFDFLSGVNVATVVFFGNILDVSPAIYSGAVHGAGTNELMKEQRMNTALTLTDRANLYSKAHPKWPALRVTGRWIDGMWIMGNNYRNSGYYGAYPHTYLERVGSMFPDATKVLHLFSGSIPPGNYIRFDRLPGADVVGDAERLSSYFPPKSFDLVYSDPPYSQEDCDHYGCAMVNRNKVLSECVKVLEPSGFIVWLDQVLPMFRKIELKMCGVIGMVKSTNHRFRVVTLFRKLG